MLLKDAARKYIPISLRNWLRSPKATVRYLSDRLASVSGRSSHLEVRPGWSIRCHPASQRHFAVFKNDPLQSAELDDFAAACVPGMQLLDVGSHFGFFALAALHYGGPHARVVCVEASAKAVGVLRRNLALSGALDRVQIVEAAAGNEDGFVQMVATGPIADDYFLVARESRLDTQPVPQVTLPTVLDRTGMHPTHVKIDVEGFESEVIAGAFDFLAAQKPVLFLELHGDYLRDRGINPEAVVRKLMAAGYCHFEQAGQQVDLAKMADMSWNCRFTCRS